MHRVATGFSVHSVTRLVHAQTQTTANFLPLCSSAVRMSQGADLENVGVVPAFTQGGVREDKPGRLIKAQQAFFVLQNQIVCRNIIGKLTATLQLTVYTSAGFLINAEVTLVNAANFVCSRTQILLIFRVKHSQILIQNIQIFLFKHLAIFAQDFIAVFVILTIFGNLVNKE